MKIPSSFCDLCMLCDRAKAWNHHLPFPYRFWNFAEIMFHRNCFSPRSLCEKKLSGRSEIELDVAFVDLMKLTKKEKVGMRIDVGSGFRNGFVYLSTFFPEPCPDLPEIEKLPIFNIGQVFTNKQLLRILFGKFCLIICSILVLHIASKYEIKEFRK